MAVVHLDSDNASSSISAAAWSGTWLLFSVDMESVFTVVMELVSSVPESVSDDEPDVAAAAVRR